MQANITEIALESNLNEALLRENTDTQEIDEEQRADSRYSSIVCICAFFCTSIVFGANYYFELYLTWYLEQKYGRDAFVILGIIATIAILAMSFTRLVSGKVIRSIGLSKTVVLGGLIGVLGSFASYFILLDIYQFVTIVISLSIVVGLVFSAAATSIFQWFDKHTLLALVIMISGSAFGELVVPVMFTAAVKTVGLQPAVITISLLFFVIISFLGQAFKPRESAIIGFLPIKLYRLDRILICGFIYSFYVQYEVVTAALLLYIISLFYKSAFEPFGFKEYVSRAYCFFRTFGVIQVVFFLALWQFFPVGLFVMVTLIFIVYILSKRGYLTGYEALE